LQDAEAVAAAMRLEQQIIAADCQVLIAILNFLQQDWGSYMKGAWVLRKAWKIYQESILQNSVSAENFYPQNLDTFTHKRKIYNLISIINKSLDF
jgi:hypothetical protein